ncbi:replication protein A 70 kDa DNA-binding subunit B-like [Senna tora]|uniref:Replication protein A 70 kDa DNA-binding subunit B-like n=1 Tax=Senna tora TaxID=362788 RepID=A0A834SRT0_9FABA|nr:replication protein A 70 kDa DNA-binding subunit B-like [Senna tora]
MHDTRILINEDLDEFRQFGYNLHPTDIKSPLNGSSSSSVLSSSPCDDPFAAMSVTSISDLFIADNESVHCIVASVLKVNTDKGLYYDACKKCFKKLDTDGEIFYCTKCETSVPTPEARFRIKLVVIDDNDTANIVIFEKDVANFLMDRFSRNKIPFTCKYTRLVVILVHKSLYLCLILLQISDDSLQTLEEFNRFLGKPFVFKVSVKLNKLNPIPSFTVQKMSCDKSIVERLTKFTIEDQNQDNCELTQLNGTDHLTATDDNSTPNQVKLPTSTKNINGRRLSFNQEIATVAGDTLSSN